MRDADPNVGFGISTTLDLPGRSDSRGSYRFVRKFYWKFLQKNALAGASGAERTAHEKKGADYRPSARRRPSYVRRGTGGCFKLH